MARSSNTSAPMGTDGELQTGSGNERILCIWNYSLLSAHGSSRTGPLSHWLVGSVSLTRPFPLFHSGFLNSSRQALGFLSLLGYATQGQGFEMCQLMG